MENPEPITPPLGVPQSLTTPAAPPTPATPPPPGGPTGTPTSRERGSNGVGVERSLATKYITYTLLGTFVASLIALFSTSTALLRCDGKPADLDVYKGWFDLMKNGLILLGTALTTIIGYYFGQRESSVAYQQADDARTTAKTEQVRAEGATALASDLEARLKAAELTLSSMRDDKEAAAKNASDDPIFDPTRLSRPERPVGP